MKRPTLDQLLNDLETAKQYTIEDRQVTGIILATMAQAKLLGLDKGEVRRQDGQIPLLQFNPM